MNITYHNPENLSDWGHADGWRLLTTEEIKQPLPEDAEYWSGKWGPSSWRGLTMSVFDQENTVYRTKQPLPASPLVAQLDAEIKAKQELREIALAVEAGAEWEAMVWSKWIDPENELEYYVKNQYKVRLKPKPVTRDWNRPEDVPGPVCWLRGPWLLGECMVTQITSNCIYTAGGRCFDLSKTGECGYYQIKDHEYSTDRINWKPCTTEEAK